MRNTNTRKMITCAVMAALICLLTMIHIVVPATGGYIHPGDGMIMAAGFILGGPLAGVAAGIGSVLADFLLGAAVYAPATLVIKLVMGLMAGLTRRWRKWPLQLLVMFLAECVAVGGYFLYEGFMFGWPAAAMSLYMNLIQGAGGMAIGMALIALVPKILPNGALGGDI